MKCPYCNQLDTRVIDSRPAEDGNSIRRRRSCDACGKRFTTSEKVETILSACYKRPVPAVDIQRVIDRVEMRIFSLEVKEVPSSRVGEIVMEELKELDEVAYVRFASVYREFKDVNTFMDELKKILK